MVWWQWCLSVACVVAAALWRLWAARLRTAALGPPPLPLLGNALLFRKRPVLLNTLWDLHRRYGDVFRFYVGPKLFLVITKPEDAQKVLSASRERDPDFIRPLKTSLGNGLVTNKGEIWKRHRRMIEPTFHSEVVGCFVDSFNESAAVLCDWVRAAAGRQVDLHQGLMHAAVCSFFHSSFGISPSQLDPDADLRYKFGEYMMADTKIVQERTFQPWLQIDWLYFLTKEGRQYKRRLDWYLEIVGQGIEIMRKQKRDGTVKNGRKTLMDVLVASNGDLLLSEEEVIDEVKTFAAAGTDTTATAMSFVLAMLGLHPEWQEAAAQELRQVYGAAGDFLRPSTAQDLSRLPVLESIIKETMWLFPTVPCGLRLMPQDVYLDSGVVVPRGSCALVAYPLLQRRADCFSRPDEFDPGRFQPGGEATRRHPYSYLPFGGGPRRCVGAQYSLLQMKALLAALLRRFHVRVCCSRSDLEQVTLSIVGHPTEPFLFICQPRDAPVPVPA